MNESVRWLLGDLEGFYPLEPFTVDGIRYVSPQAAFRMRQDGVEDAPPANTGMVTRRPMLSLHEDTHCDPECDADPAEVDGCTSSAWHWWPKPGEVRSSP